jgi:hypothetical protein
MEITTAFALPHMPEAEQKGLSIALTRATTYVEFGMGGSTTLAAQLGVPHIIAVDSSKDWVHHVSQQISQLHLQGTVDLLHANIGETGDWGYPKDASLIANWPSYYAGPWNTARQKNLNPDLVLVDGRFRVACFLYSLIHLQPGATILWDDYLHRPEYHCVEAQLAPVGMYGAMAQFKVNDNIDKSKVVVELFTHLYELD